MPLPPCEICRIACYGRPLFYPYWVVIRRIGQELPGGMRIVFARPVPSVITPQTQITFVERCDVETEELKHNVLITIKYERSEDYLIYPKDVWEEVSHRYVEPLSEGKAPKEAGLFLHGPPGTGKTSMMELLSDMLALYRVEIRPDAVLSKYVGEAEKRLARMFEQAISNEPSIIIADDADWLVRSREFAAASEESMVTLTLLSILLYRIPKLKREGRRVLVCAATNISPQHIDPALLRSGRLGKPIFVPLPDFEAIYTLMQRMGLEGMVDDCEKLAKRLANLGANMADVKQYISELLEGREPKIEPYVGRGYIRPFPELPDIDLVKRFKDTLPKSLFTDPRTRIYFGGNVSITEAFLVTYLTMLGVGTVLLIDERHFDEALLSASTTKSVLLVNTELISDQTLRIIYSSARCPVIFYGSRVPPLPVFSINGAGAVMTKLDKLEFLKLIFGFYGVKATEAELKELIRKVSDNELEKVLTTIKYRPYTLEELKKMIERLRLL